MPPKMHMEPEPGDFTPEVGAAFISSVGGLGASLTVLLAVAEPLRNAGKYTMADVLAYRLRPRPVRAMAALSTLTISTLYMIAQMVGAGALVAGLTISASTSFAHDFWSPVVRHGVTTSDEEVRVARVSAVVLGAVSIA